VNFLLPFVLDAYATFPYDKRVRNLILCNEVICTWSMNKSDYVCTNNN